MPVEATTIVLVDRLIWEIIYGKLWEYMGNLVAVGHSRLASLRKAMGEIINGDVASAEESLAGRYFNSTSRAA